MNKTFFGFILGICAGLSMPMLAYYSSYTDLCDLNAGDMKSLVREVVNDCSIYLYSNENGQIDC